MVFCWDVIYVDVVYLFNFFYSVVNLAEVLESLLDMVWRVVFCFEWFGIFMYYYLSGFLGRGVCCKIDRMFQGDGFVIGVKVLFIVIGLNKQCVYIIVR